MNAVRRFGWLLVCALLSSGCASRYIVPYPREAIHHEVVTPDGWKLALVEYPAVGPVRGRPVLVCHGISANARNVDLDETHSLVRWLAAHGRPAWTISLRGMGGSDRPDPAAHRGAYTFDSFWQQDLPAAINFIRQQTGAESIDSVGHSMGGMVLYAYLAEGGTGIHAAATLGSPTRLDFGLWFAPMVPSLAKMVNPEWVLPMVGPARFSAPLASTGHGDILERLLFNPENVTQQSWQRLNASGIGDVTGALLRQMAPLVVQGRFASADGSRDFRRDMANIRTPILVVAGKADHIGMTVSVRDGYRALGGPKRWLLVAEENGARADYGHMDLVIGERAAEEVWTPVLDFLDAPNGASAH